jgi:hypothetical protein
MRKINYHEYSSPIQVVVKNENNEQKHISVFGSEFNEFENKDISSVFNNEKYSSIQKALINCVYGVDLIRVQLSTKNSKGQFDSKKSILNLESFIINMNCKDINGQEMTIPIIVKSYIDPKQFIKYIADIKYKFNLDSSVALNFLLPPKTQVVITIFPFYTNKLGAENYYGEHGMIQMIRNINHPFSEILIGKIDKARELKDIHSQLDLIKQKGAYSYPRIIFNQKIDELLFGIHDIPADIYRNMVNLYVELNDYVGELQHRIESLKKDKKLVDKFSVDNFLSKLEDEIGVKKDDKKSVIKKQLAKKENKETLDIFSKKVNNKKSTAKKSVKKVTKKVSKK